MPTSGAMIFTSKRATSDEVAVRRLLVRAHARRSAMTAISRRACSRLSARASVVTPRPAAAPPTVRSARLLPDCPLPAPLPGAGTEAGERSAYLMSGTYDLLLFLEGRTLREVAQFVSERLSPLEGILSTSTHFMLKTYKRFGVLMHQESSDERLSVSP